MYVPCVSEYLVIFFKDVVHLCYVLTADGFNDVSLVIGGVKAGTTSALSLANKRCAAGQRVLHTIYGNKHVSFKKSQHCKSPYLIHFIQLTD